ncbi:MAG: DUF5996 family protein [Acidobacteriia bacterium]|nr:DUF5996 family protein [Terriglobia bacterium]
MNPNWPALPLSEWADTYRSLHMWTQVVGKIRMELTPPLNHFWNVTLYVNSRGLTTGPIPYPGGLFEMQFDFLDHQLRVTTSEGGRAERALCPEPVASFYRAALEMLPSVGVVCEINPMPQEVPDAIPFDQDNAPGAYDPEYAHRHWKILVSTSKVFEKFRAKFIGKCSPVHFFWGSFDLACTRFSGKLAPPRKGVISGPAYSHEESSAGFWPGGSGIDGPAYYAYTVPAPAGIDRAPVKPAAARWDAKLGEFILMYDDVRSAASPEDALSDFLQSTYEAGANLGNWDRAALEAGP